ncbi:hypothetical protein CGLO_08573 [Colletotrichum gloeosporioides Cg-14]|nr:hypothetical protein CGLO_08573 [Colletotrichum gloeosporioides Cg-14]
MECLLIP